MCSKAEYFDEACYKDMVRKDPVAAVLFAIEAPPNQRGTLRRWFKEALGLKLKVDLEGGDA